LNDSEPTSMPAFEVLFETHQDRVFNTVMLLIQHRQDAEDVTQEVFVKAYEMLPKFKGDSSVGTWLYRIAVNTALNYLRAKKTKKRSGFLVALWGGKEDESPVDIADFVHPGVALERQEQAAILFKAISQLPENQRVAFSLSKVEDMSYAEIAQIMQVSYPSVESLIFRAKQNLQKLLRDFYRN
jgi:RNA polymerase sigma factor (sigma-70 family)